jgi:hypothetical protein
MSLILNHPRAEAFRYGPIKGRASFDASTSSFTFSHSQPFGYGPDKLPTSNWFGVSVYNPDWLVVIDKRVFITLSLSGMTCPYDERYDALFMTRSVKYIRIEFDRQVVWETWTGELPPAELTQRIEDALNTAQP